MKKSVLFMALMAVTGSHNDSRCAEERLVLDR